MNTKLNRMRVLFVLLAVLLIVESVFCVPYDNIAVFRSKQNVPHSEIIGSGYTTIFDIADDDALIYRTDLMATGKRVSTPRLAINISVTLILFVVVYMLFFRENKKPFYSEAKRSEQLSLFDCLDESEKWSMKDKK